jgi:hypothetical protein
MPWRFGPRKSRRRPKHRRLTHCGPIESCPGYEVPGWRRRRKWGRLPPARARGLLACAPGCLGRAGVLGEGPFAGTEDVVPHTKLGHIPADRFDRPRHIHATHANVRCAKAEAHYAEHVRQAGHDMPVTDMKAGCVHAYEHVVVANHGCVDVDEFEDLASAAPPNARSFNSRIAG